MKILLTWSKCSAAADKKTASRKVELVFDSQTNREYVLNLGFQKANSDFNVKSLAQAKFVCFL